MTILGVAFAGIVQSSIMTTIHVIRTRRTIILVFRFCYLLCPFSVHVNDEPIAISSSHGGKYVHVVSLSRNSVDDQRCKLLDGSLTTASSNFISKWIQLNTRIFEKTNWNDSNWVIQIIIIISVAFIGIHILVTSKRFLCEAAPPVNGIPLIKPSGEYRRVTQHTVFR